MMCGITGTPGTGKSIIANELAIRGHTVVHIVDTIGPYVSGDDEERDTRLIDTERWAAEFVPVDGFVEGHFAHLLSCDKIVVLRCRPDILKKRLAQRKYPARKIEENTEAEAMDVCLVEAVELFRPEQILELDTTENTPSMCADTIADFACGKIPARFGFTDWSEFIGAR
jgi:adenylate kinase